MTPTTFMTHIAIQEALGGRMVEWMEYVADEQDPSGRVTTVDDLKA